MLSFLSLLQEVIEQQRVCNMVSEVMHSISHSFHALSDLMVDLSQPCPRQLYITFSIFITGSNRTTACLQHGVRSDAFHKSQLSCSE